MAAVTRTHPATITRAGAGSRLRCNPEVADQSKMFNSHEPPLPRSRSHAATGPGARIVPWRQRGDWLIKSPIASTARPARARPRLRCQKNPPTESAATGLLICSAGCRPGWLVRPDPCSGKQAVYVSPAKPGRRTRGAAARSAAGDSEIIRSGWHSQHRNSDVHYRWPEVQARVPLARVVLMNPCRLAQPGGPGLTSVPGSEFALRQPGKNQAWILDQTFGTERTNVRNRKNERSEPKKLQPPAG